MKKDKIVFYVQLSKKLPEYYIHLALSLGEYGIKLVPMSFDDIMELPKYKRLMIIAVINDFDSFDKFKRIRRRYLDFAVINEKIRLIHLSSFDPVRKLRKEEKAKNYLFLKLPSEFDILSSEINEFIETKKKEIKTWPFSLETINES